ncbi:3'-5' exonuclease [Pararhizobium haloflavum]|uniref:3'-5' exonuclease n=1 Tax=Pararhizobium haloflavum TaxID=2037914 RepID=UPI000C18C3E6|nr:exonuclease domain-containing protein [Pararhizobium haloflavum]
MSTPKFVVFDTETSGLFVFRDKATNKPVPADHPSQPRMYSFAAILADEHGRAIDRKKLYVRPDGWTVAEFDRRAIAEGKRPASEINGLSDDFLTEHGVPIREILDLWNGYVDDDLIAVAFNAQFDCKMMRAELRRAALPDRFEDTRNICAMRSLDPYGRDGLPIMRGFVKLAVACEWFGIVNDNAHDAMADAEAARAILEIMIQDGRLPDARVHYAAA